MEEPRQYSSEFQTETYKNSRIQYRQHRRGFTKYTIESGENTVLRFTNTHTGGPTSETGRLVTELVIEIIGVPPHGIELSSDRWMSQAIYRYGDRVIQFESLKYSGTFKLENGIHADDIHGHVGLTFFDPKIDVFETKNVTVNIAF